MSRVGKQPIEIPKGVEVKIDGRIVSVKGPKGNLSQEIRHDVKVELVDNTVVLTIDESKKELKSFWGLYRALIQNMVTGTTKGFEKHLLLEGVGFRAAVQGKDLVLQLGYSHPCVCPIPEGLQASVEKNVNVLISGADRQLVGAFAALVRSKRKPEPYKGKGVRYKGEYIRRKAGKSGGK